MTGVNVFGALSTSVSVSLPLAVGLPCSLQSGSVTEPVMQPWMMAGSFVPWMVIVTTCAVPSMVVTVKVSVRVS